MRREIEFLEAEKCVSETERLKQILEQHDYKVSIRRDGSLALAATPERRLAKRKLKESRDWLRAVFNQPASASTKQPGKLKSASSEPAVAEKTEICQSGEWLRAVLNASRDGILVEDAGKIVFINQAFAQLLGYDAPEELFETATIEIIAPEEIARMTAFGDSRLRGAAAEGEEPPSIYEFRGRRKDGSLIDLEASVSVARIGGRTYIIAALRDLTGHKRAARLVKESEQRYRLLGDSILHQVWTAQPDGALDYVNARTLEYLGLTRTEALKAVWQEAVHPDDLAICVERWNQSLLTGAPYEVEFRMRDAAGNYRWHLGRATAGRDAGGKIVKWFGTNTDINDQKLAEQSLHESEARLRQSQKMEAIGTLTGGVAHDFNNLLTAILGNTQLAQRNLAPDDPVQTRLNEIECAGTRAAALTRQLLAFSRRQHLERKTITLTDSVCEMTKLLERIIGEDVEVTVECADNLPSVYADAAQIEQVIMNLAINARDAMPNGGKLLIETSEATLDASYCRHYPYVQPGKYVQIRVSDTGTGMDEETKRRIFEPFFTTKEVGKGTGLGLSMAYGIVKQHDGHINVYSEIGYGTNIRVYLPVHEQTAEAEAQQAALPFFGGTETILVAEDEKALRDLAKDVLETSGYTVLLAKNGEEAVKLFEENRERIDLLLFDVVMPRMSGAEAFECIRDAGADVPVIFMTGYSSETVQNRFVKQNKLFVEHETAIVQKPYSVELIESKIREVLDNHRRSISSNPAAYKNYQPQPRAANAFEITR